MNEPLPSLLTKDDDVTKKILKVKRELQTVRRICVHRSDRMSKRTTDQRIDSEDYCPVAASDFSESGIRHPRPRDLEITTKDLLILCLKVAWDRVSEMALKWPISVSADFGDEAKEV
jgi:hypothetical protein